MAFFAANAKILSSLRYVENIIDMLQICVCDVIAHNTGRVIFT